MVQKKSKDYPEDMFDFLYRIEATHFWFSGRNKIIKSFLSRFTNNNKTLDLLEVGCGNGYVLSALGEFKFRLTGIDIYRRAIDLAKKRTDAKLIKSDFRKLSPKKKYDIICFFDVIEHIKSDTGFLKKANALLSKNGKLFVTVPAHDYLWTEIDKKSGHKRRYTKKILINKLEASGFNPKNLSYFGLINFLPQFVARKINNPKTLTKALESPQPIINKLLLIGMILESKIIKFSNIPYGSSIILYAEKK